ncbi:HetZ-related protein 2 [Romeria aff. gracilis LEGE 07310]|uniref:HetZ-related protein 2 n=1 Tax=Vasconcelosia minhoensis LEGE 07310 TaxID=915328 RepID=A0A8J7AAE3_9CYAN|nr:HetZ-related protein 2 [Romeria gracilis]MBE9077111.1 HetZ-related protein 2 [Romeria aff. gracilis LEGE 07310]
MSLAESIAQEWRQRLQDDLPGQADETRDAVVHWLVGEEPARLNALPTPELKLAQQAMAYRYRIFCENYWGQPPDRAYQKLLKKLGGLFLIRTKVRTWIALSRDRRRAVKDVLQEVIQEMIQSDRHLQQQLRWIGQCTDRSFLRSLLMLATVEEYCLRPIRNQPLLVYRFVNYLRRSQRGGMTQVPSAELIQLISEEIGTDAAEGTLSLLDFEALALHQEQEVFQEQQALRSQVKQEFLSYLNETLDATAAQWLELHLQGYGQDAIAQQLGLTIKQAYRLREKVSYHAIRIFTLKQQPDLVFSWLKTSVQEHNLGLTLEQWEQYWNGLDPSQQALLSAFKDGKTADEVAQALDLKPKQVMSEWAKLYLAAQSVRLSA